MSHAEIHVPARVRQLFSSVRLHLFTPKPAPESTLAAPVAESLSITPVDDKPDDFQRDRLEHIFNRINQYDGPAIDPPDPIDRAVLYVRMSAGEKK
jgi:hypothetical protein